MMRRICNTRPTYGFTLAELLISVALLGVISSFSIAKITRVAVQSKHQAIYREAVAAISQAYEAYRQTIPPSANTSAMTLMRYLNCVYYAPNGTLVDHVSGKTSLTCAGAPSCCVLHNGAIIMEGGTYFGATSTNHFIHFIFDPDGRYSGGSFGMSKSQVIDLYFNGRINSGSDRHSGVDVTYQGGGPQTWSANAKPEWWTDW